MGFHSPTPAPTNYPYSASKRYNLMLAANIISIFDRCIIAVVCLRRLYKYHRAGVLRCGEAKTVFHVAMLCTVPLCLPNFVFCASHADLWQCYVERDHQLYVARWGLYALYRVGLCLQLLCLSITVLTWASFLRGGRYITELFHPERNDRLWWTLCVINILSVASALATGIVMIAEPDRLETKTGTQLTAVVYINWLVFDLFQIYLILFLLFHGFRLHSRIQDTAVFDDRDRFGMLVRLMGTLAVMTSCLLIEVTGRFILSLELFVGADRWDSSHHPPAYTFLEDRPVIWQFVGYILPYDVVSFCLLYLMRTPPKPRHCFEGAQLSTDSVTEPLTDGADQAEEGSSLPAWGGGGRQDGEDEALRSLTECGDHEHDDENNLVVSNPMSASPTPTSTTTEG